MPWIVTFYIPVGQRSVKLGKGAVYMGMEDNTYNHLVPTYRPKPLTKYDTHKASELRNIVNEITKLTKESPTYFVRMNDAKQTYLLGVKESAIMFQNGFEELCDNAPDSAFNDKKAYSSDTSKIGAKIIGKDQSKLPDGFLIRVKSLALSQVNRGRELYLTGRGLAGGTYKFQVSVGDDLYDFQYNIRNEANNKEVMNGLSSFINKANIGIHTDVVPVRDEPDKICMRIESDMTGSAAGEAIFAFADKENPNGNGLVSYLDLNRIERSPESSTFYMDGNERHTLSNEFTMGRCLKVILRDTTAEDEVVSINFYPDSDRILASLQKIADAYNFMLDSSQEFAKVASYNLKLANDIQATIRPYKPELEACGFVFNENNRILFDTALTLQAINDGELQKLFSRSSPFVQTMISKAYEIKLNPMEYIDKLMGTYPDFSKPAEGFSYITSLYSGLIFNYYF